MISYGAREMLLERGRLVLKIRELTWTNASLSMKKMDIPWSYPSRRETDGTGLGPLRLIKPENASFAAFSRHSLGYRHGSSTRVLPKSLQPINIL